MDAYDRVKGAIDSLIKAVFWLSVASFTFYALADVFNIMYNTPKINLLLSFVTVLMINIIITAIKKLQELT